MPSLTPWTINDDFSIKAAYKILKEVVELGHEYCGVLKYQGRLVSGTG